MADAANLPKILLVGSPMAMLGVAREALRSAAKAERFLPPLPALSHLGTPDTRGAAAIKGA